MLKELIDKFYLDKEKDKKREQVKFYISDAGKCPRNIFFSLKHVPKKELEAERLRIFDHGDYIQMMIQRPLFSLGIVRAVEVPIRPNEIISGRADFIISIEGVPYVVDVKSISGRLNLEKMAEPKPEHYYQVQLYLHFFKIQKGILLYINKDTQELKEFIFDYDEELANRILKWFERLKEKIEKDIVPKRIPDYPKNWQCQYCPYREICDISGAGELNWKKLKEKILKEESKDEPKNKEEIR